jgi:hypothetical protein
MQQLLAPHPVSQLHSAHEAADVQRSSLRHTNQPCKLKGGVCALWFIRYRDKNKLLQEAQQARNNPPEPLTEKAESLHYVFEATVQTHLSACGGCLVCLGEALPQTCRLVCNDITKFQGWELIMSNANV